VHLIGDGSAVSRKQTSLTLMCQFRKHHSESHHEAAVIRPTLFQSSMFAPERHATGAHYTAEADILRVVKAKTAVEKCIPSRTAGLKGERGSTTMIPVLATQVIATLLAAGPQISVQVVDELWMPAPGIEVRVAPVSSCADPKPAVKPTIGTTQKNGEVALPADGATLLVTVSSEGFLQREECIQLGTTFPGEIPKVQLRMITDPSRGVITHPGFLRGKAKNGDPRTLRLLDFVGVYRDSGGSFYEVKYSERLESLALTLPSGSAIYFRERDRLTFRSPQGVLVFRLAGEQIAGLTYTPKPIGADWFELSR
jgi:hypothetical protein